MPQNPGNAAAHCLSGQRGVVKPSGLGTVAGQHVYNITVPPGTTRTITITTPAQIGTSGYPIAVAAIKVPAGGSITTA